MPRIFVSRAIPDVGLNKLRAFAELDVWNEDGPVPRNELLKRVRGCDGLLTMLSDTIDAAVMDAAGEQLKVISNYAVGYNNIDISQANRRGIQVGNTPDVLTDATADLAFALLIAAARRLGEAQRSVIDGAWHTWSPTGFIGQDIRGKTIGIVGLGRIGMAMARRCHGGWGMRVIYTAQSDKPHAEAELGARRVSFEELLSQSDFISVHAPLNDQTRGLFDADAFACMKPTSVFVNTARGLIHDHDALYASLRDGQIFSAGLDVTHPEPLPASDPLLTLSNCIVIPHIGSATLSSRNDMAEIAADNLIFGLSGGTLRCWVNPPAP